MSISGVNETASSIYYYCTSLLFHIMTELSPIMLIVSTVWSLYRACDAIREGHWNAPTIAADRQHSNLKRTLSRRGITHRPHSKYDPRVVQEEIESLRCKPVHLCAWSGPCAPISPAELKSVPVCSDGAQVGELELVRGAGRGNQIQFNPAHFHQCAVLPRVVLWCVVWCVVLQCSSRSSQQQQQQKRQQGLPTAVSLVARTLDDSVSE